MPTIGTGAQNDLSRKSVELSRITYISLHTGLEELTAPLAIATGGGWAPTFVVASLLKNVRIVRLGSITLNALYKGDGRV